MSKPQPKKLNHAKLSPHPLGAIFPPMGDAEYASLLKGMKENGFDPQHPIVIYEGQILEGNHRYTAAKATKTVPLFRNFENLAFDGSPIDYVMQENLRRRNLNPSQLATLGAELVEQMEKVAAEESANLQASDKKKADGEKVKKAAKATKISARSIAKARALKKKDPKAAAEVKRGKKSLNKATTEADNKISAAQAKTEEYEKAVARIDKACGVGWTLKTANENTLLKSKDILQLGGLDTDELKRLKPFLEAGWKLKDALGYKSVELSMKHTLAQAAAFALHKGGAAEFNVGRWNFTAAYQSK